MQRITPKDIARLLSGEIEDADEFVRIGNAIRSDAGLARLADAIEPFCRPIDEEDDQERTAEPPAWLTQQLKELAESRLCPMQSRGIMAALFSDEASVTGEFLLPADEAANVKDASRCGFTIRRRPDDLHAFILTIDGDLGGYRPVGLIVGHFQHASCAPANEESALEDSPPNVRPRSQEGTPRGKAERESPAQRLAAEDGLGPDDSAQQRRRDDRKHPSGELQVRFDESLCRVVVKVPPNRAGETVIAEMRSVDRDGQPVVQRRPVHLKLQLPDGRYGGYARFGSVMGLAGYDGVSGDRGDEQDYRDHEVRALTNNELHLLDREAVTDFLGRQQFTAMPLWQTDEGYLFEANEMELDAMLDRGACWCLRVSDADVEG